MTGHQGTIMRAGNQMTDHQGTIMRLFTNSDYNQPSEQAVSLGLFYIWTINSTSLASLTIALLTIAF
jgi:hypothetical protein